MAMTWKDAIQTVLAESDEPLHVNEIARRILDAQLVATKGATPAYSVSAVAYTSMKDEGERSPFLLVGPATFALRRSPRMPDQMGTTSDRALSSEEQVASAGVVKAFGISWRRDRVDWDPILPRLMGEQAAGATPVDFGSQVGLYLLYDANRCVYAGRISEPRLAKRLREHARDRLSGRWDRFSWFGLRAVSDEARLQSLPPTYSAQSVVAGMEALLIECMEPALNRRQGDAIGDLEFLQADDPKLSDKRKAAMVVDILAKMGTT